MRKRNESGLCMQSSWRLVEMSLGYSFLFFFILDYSLIAILAILPFIYSVLLSSRICWLMIFCECLKVKTGSYCKLFYYIIR